MRRGKEVLAVVELKARFDEEANINWAERLEALGAQVVYGIVGLKTHGKMMLVTRREGGRLRRYAHLSTGNYNPKTARLYTDVGYLTSQPDMTADVDRVFQQLSSLTQMRSTRQLLLAPSSMHSQMVRCIQRVADSARAGGPARIVVKVNSLTDEPLTRALIEAGQAGAQIDLIVRGACILPPGVPGRRTTSGCARWWGACWSTPACCTSAGRGRARRGALPVERRLDEPQHDAAHRGGLAGARPGPAPARDRRVSGAVSARWQGCLDPVQRRALRARAANRTQCPAGPDGLARFCHLNDAGGPHDDDPG